MLEDFATESNLSVDDEFSNDNFDTKSAKRFWE